MTFTDKQKSELDSGLNQRHVKQRKQGGATLSYIEGWHAIAEANRIFGFDGWSRETVYCKQVCETYQNKNGNQVACYAAKVRVEAGGIVREGTGYGDGISYDLGQAHESAIKEAECVPTSTKILTPTGFKAHTDIRIGDVVAGYDIALGKTVWTTLTGVVTYDNTPVVRIRNARTFDIVCTPDHDWVVRRHGNFSKKPFRETDTQDAILCAAPMETINPLPVSDDVAARIGFAICDGSFKRTKTGRFCRFSVYQSKPETVEMCRRMYGSFSLERRRKPANGFLPNGLPRSDYHPGYVWDVRAKHSQEWLSSFGITEPECLPSVVSGLSPSARKSMLTAMMLADGTKSGVFGKKRKPWVMDILRILCALSGIYTGLTRKSSAGDVPLVRLQKKPVVTAWNCSSEPHGSCDVWCPKTKTGTWVAQFENGLTTITGNTDAMKRALMTFGNPFGLALYDKDQANVIEQDPDPTPADIYFETAMEIIRSHEGPEDELREWWKDEKEKRRNSGINNDQVHSLLETMRIRFDLASNAPNEREIV